MLSGCGLAEMQEHAAAEQQELAAQAAERAARQPPGVNPSPDPRTDCGHTNGTGVYFQELGSARILFNQVQPPNDQGTTKPTELMITTFVNPTAISSLGPSCGPGTLRSPASPVQFCARYFDAFLGVWRFWMGTVDRAEYPGAPSWSVIDVTENRTVPRWTLQDTTTGVKVTVKDAQLADLKLHLTFTPISSAPARFIVEFDNGEILPPIMHPRVDPLPEVHAFHMTWRREGSPEGSGTEYCRDGTDTHEPDPIAFQRDIYVDPVNGSVTRGSPRGYVTMSCNLGSMVTAHRWGYGYLEGSDTTFHFDSAIHMKRASYCGNSEFFTQPDTVIHITDDRIINLDIPLAPIEAWWDRSGAKCLDLNHRRRPDEFPFNGNCGDHWIPACPPPKTFPYLVNAFVGARS